MSGASCLYEGTIRHRRLQPRHEFRHRLFLAYLDLDELPDLFGGRLVSERPGIVRFRRRDYLGDPQIPLADAVRDGVQDAIGSRPDGPIRVLTQLRSFGHCFNPASFYYCFDREGQQVDALLVEVTNTPWGERRAYVIQPNQQSPQPGSAILRGSFDKALHVSPFMGMDQTYSCRASRPAETLSVHIENRSAGERVFDATLALRRRELTRTSLVTTTARYPAATIRVLGLIYMHALGLRLAGARVFPHPEGVAS